MSTVQKVHECVDEFEGEVNSYEIETSRAKIEII